MAVSRIGGRRRWVMVESSRMLLFSLRGVGPHRVATRRSVGSPVAGAASARGRSGANPAPDANPGPDAEQPGRTDGSGDSDGAKMQQKPPASPEGEPLPESARPASSLVVGGERGCQA